MKAILFLSQIADDAGRFGWFLWLVDHWQTFAAIATAAAGIAGVVWYVRKLEKANLFKTNKETIEGLEKLIATREKQVNDLQSDVQERDETISELTDELDELRENFDILETEYKSIVGIRIAELLAWAGNMENWRAADAEKESQIRILKGRIEIMEKREAENAAIHKTE